jgi:hypothetical protein
MSLLGRSVAQTRAESWSRLIQENERGGADLGSMGMRSFGVHDGVLQGSCQSQRKLGKQFRSRKTMCDGFGQ